MSYIGKLTVKYLGASDEQYNMIAPSPGEDYAAELKGCDWGESNERLVYTGDPKDKKIEELVFEVSDASYSGLVGVNIDDALKASLKLPLYSLYQVPRADGEEHDHRLSTKTTPGWTLKVKVKKRLSS